jgi:hypothetical protein
MLCHDNDQSTKSDSKKSCICVRTGLGLLADLAILCSVTWFLAQVLLRGHCAWPVDDDRGLLVRAGT